MPTEADADRIRGWITYEATKASRDPAYARRKGIVPTGTMTLFEPAGRATGPAAWLRGAAIALMPKGWRYEIIEGTGGSAQLVLRGYEP